MGCFIEILELIVLLPFSIVIMSTGSACFLLSVNLFVILLESIEKHLHVTLLLQELYYLFVLHLGRRVIRQDIHKPGRYEWIFPELYEEDFYLEFAVKSGHDASVVFSPSNDYSDEAYEIRKTPYLFHFALSGFVARMFILEQRSSLLTLRLIFHSNPWFQLKLL